MQAQTFINETICFPWQAHGFWFQFFKFAFIQLGLAYVKTLFFNNIIYTAT